MMSAFAVVAAAAASAAIAHADALVASAFKRCFRVFIRCCSCSLFVKLAGVDRLWLFAFDWAGVAFAGFVGIVFLGKG